MEILEKIMAVMMGHVVADALGVPVEFQGREELDLNPVVDMRGFGTYSVPAGSWSDDSSMAIATLDSLACGTVDFDDIMRRFIDWSFNGKYTPTGYVFDIGGACSTAISDYYFGKRPATSCGGVGDYSNGNGSVMRIHPVVLYSYVKGLGTEEWLDLVAGVGCLTHGHERSEIGCGIYSFVLMELLCDASRESVYVGLKKAEEHYKSYAECKHYSRLFDPDFEFTDRADIKSSGYVVDSLEAAIWCLITTDNYKDCVLRAVNLGLDTDTVAAIAGGLAGALYGYGAIPSDWLETVINKDYIENMCERALASWQNNNI